MAKEDKKPEAARSDKRAELIKEAEQLGIKLPRISIAGFKSKKPEDVEKEKVRVEKQFIHSVETAIAKHKANAKLKPIEKRKAVLTARFRAVKSRTRAHTYTDANIKAWLEELTMINTNPKSWNKVTKNGTKPFVPGNKKKKTARDILDEMDLED